MLNNENTDPSEEIDFDKKYSNWDPTLTMLKFGDKSGDLTTIFQEKDEGLYNPIYIAIHIEICRFFIFCNQKLQFYHF